MVLPVFVGWTEQALHQSGTSRNVLKDHSIDDHLSHVISPSSMLPLRGIKSLFDVEESLLAPRREQDLPLPRNV